MNVEQMRDKLQMYCDRRTCFGCPVGMCHEEDVCIIRDMSDDVVRECFHAAFCVHFDFGEALKALKTGKRVSREGWNGKGLFVVYQKGYPQGIPCNKQTAEAWGMKEGELFRCEPYLQINTVDGSHAMWVPSIRDCLAEDWFVMDE